VQVSQRRVQARRSRATRRWAAAGVALVLFAGIALGLAFAGSPERIAEGVRIAGVDVGGMRPSQARQVLERRAGMLAHTPVVFITGERRWRIAPAKVGLRVDWAAAVKAALRNGDGFGPVRGFRRLGVRFFGEDVTPASTVFEPALSVRVGTIARTTNRLHREAGIKLRGLQPVILPAQAGSILDREAAKRTIVHALTGFERKPVSLPYRVDPPDVTAADLAPVAQQVRTALSAPVRLSFGGTYLRLARWRVAQLLDVPRDGGSTLAIGGPGADRYFARLKRFVNRAPVNADFAVYSDGVQVTPAKNGRELDAPATARGLLAAAVSRTHRVARLAVATEVPERTTAEAKAMGIVGLVGAYTTIYGGEPNRIHNVQLVAHLIDRHLIAPGETFSFNQTTGERSAEKGFLEAPVIINGELQTGLGGGVCQVSTTTFNAAYESGLKITERTNHALYISHYPQGRDATVNYPDTDLKFVNDTDKWLLLRTWVGADSLTVALYGTPVNRKVESEVAPLRETGPPPVKKVKNPELLVGKTVVEDAGSPSLATSVTRRVYKADGKLLYDDAWPSSYRAEPKVVLVGTKPKPKKKKPPAQTTTTPTTTTGPTATEPTATEPTTTDPTATSPTTTQPTRTTPGP
jgi:vancomycin resistance protein YoaR